MHGRLTKETNHVETRNDLAMIVVVYVLTCSKRKQSSNGTSINQNFELHARRGNFTSDEVDEFDAIILSTRMMLEVPVEPAMPCATRKRILTAKTQTHKVAVCLGVDPQQGGKGDSLSQKGEAKTSVRVPKLYSSQKAKLFAGRSRCRSRVSFMASF